MPACLVTGATGFIGRRLCKHLQDSGWHVRAVMRVRSDGPWNESLVVDLAEDSLPPEMCQGVNTVFHLAGKAHAVTASLADEASYTRINVESTRKLLELARVAGVSRFVFFSSVKAMGERGTGEDESAVPRPETAYGRSKREAERLVLEGGYVPEPVVLRLAMVYGPTRKGNLPRMIEAISRGRFPPLPDTHNKRSMVHVGDVVQAALLAADHPAAIGKTYLVTDGRSYSTRQIYEWICEALGRQPPGWCLPLPLLRLMAWAGDGIGALFGRRFIFDSGALEKLIGSSWYNSERIARELGFSAHRHLRDEIPEMASLLTSSSN
jgi:nucleoside-diphosphate-sugar epimerase